MTPTESAIQAECFKWYNNKYCLKHHKPRNLIFAILNEGQMHKRQQGLVAGVPDLFIIHYGRLIWVEMKTPKGRQSEVQKQFEKRVTDNNQGEYHLIRSVDAFQKIFVDDKKE